MQESAVLWHWEKTQGKYAACQGRAAATIHECTRRGPAVRTSRASAVKDAVMKLF